MRGKQLGSKHLGEGVSLPLSLLCYEVGTMIMLTLQSFWDI